MNAHKQGPAEDAILSPKDVRYSTRLLELLTAAENNRRAQARTGSNDQGSLDDILAVARLCHLLRQNRSEYFSPAMFGEPAWDILLALFLKAASDTPATVSNLARSAGIPVTTAFRWLDYLEEKRLIERHPSAEDGRAVTVILADEGRRRLERYFADMLATMEALRVESGAAGS